MGASKTFKYSSRFFVLKHPVLFFIHIFNFLILAVNILGRKSIPPFSPLRHLQSSQFLTQSMWMKRVKKQWNLCMIKDKKYCFVTSIFKFKKSNSNFVSTTKFYEKKYGCKKEQEIFEPSNLFTGLSTIIPSLKNNKDYKFWLFFNKFCGTCSNPREGTVKVLLIFEQTFFLWPYTEWNIIKFIWACFTLLLVKKLAALIE